MTDEATPRKRAGRGVEAHRTRAPKRKGPASEYDEEYHCRHATAMCMLGATREDLANVFGVSAPTIDYWRKTRPEFAQALADGRVLADANVARSCYQRAIGAVTPETKVYFSKDGEVITHDLQKHHAPDAASIEFWLTNRQPDLWKRSRSQDSAPNAPVQIEIIGGPQSAQQTFIASPQSDGRSRIRDAGDDADLALRTDEGTEKLPPPGGA